jgi:DNA mismatch repair protein MutH
VTSLPPPQSEEELMERARALAGRTLGQIAALAGTPVPLHQRRMKGWVGELMERVLGANGASLPEPDFRLIGVELKTIPINCRGRPGESTWVCSVPLAGEIGDWESSVLKRKLQCVLWVPVEAPAAVPLALRRVGEPILWSPDAGQERALREDWQELTDMIAVGDLQAISARHGRVLQIRPKAANARALVRSVDRNGAPAETLPRGFYLRASFTAEIVAGEREKEKGKSKRRNSDSICRTPDSGPRHR